MDLGPLGLYIQTVAGAMQAVDKVRPKGVVLDRIALDLTDELHKNYPGIEIMGRLDEKVFVPSDPGLAYSVGQRYAERQLSSGYDVDIWMGPNEPQIKTPQQRTCLTSFELGRADVFGDKPCAVLSLAGGNGEPEHFVEDFAPLLKRPNVVVNLHAYGGDPSKGGSGLLSSLLEWYAFRYRKFVEAMRAAKKRMGRVILGECGTWLSWKGPRASPPHSAEAIAQDFIWLVERLNPYISWVACWIVCGYDGWAGWEIANEPTILEALGEYNRSHPVMGYRDAVGGGEVLMEKLAHRIWDSGCRYREKAAPVGYNPNAATHYYVEVHPKNVGAMLTAQYESQCGRFDLVKCALGLVIYDRETGRVDAAESEAHLRVILARWGYPK